MPHDDLRERLSRCKDTLSLYCSCLNAVGKFGLGERLLTNVVSYMETIFGDSDLEQRLIKTSKSFDDLIKLLHVNMMRGCDIEIEKIEKITTDAIAKMRTNRTANKLYTELEGLYSEVLEKINPVPVAPAP